MAAIGHGLGADLPLGLLDAFLAILAAEAQKAGFGKSMQGSIMACWCLAGDNGHQTVSRHVMGASSENSQH